MRTIKKMLCLCLALLLLCPLLACSGCGKMQKKVATCEGYDVRYEELRYLVLLNKSLLESTYGEHIFQTPESAEQYRAQLEAAVLEDLKENYAVLAACNYYLPELKIDSDEIEAQVDALIKSAADQVGGEQIFYDLSEQNYHMTKGFIRFSAAVSVMEDKLRQELAARGMIFADNQRVEFFDWIREGNGVYVQHLFIRNDPGERIEDNRALAEEARELLRTEEITIREAVGSAKYNQDPSNTIPYYLIKDVYDPALEAAALPLIDKWEGYVSDVVETDAGFYVFIRIDDDDDLLNAKLSSLLSSYQWAKTEEIKNTFRDGLVFEWTKFGKRLDWLEIE